MGRCTALVLCAFALGCTGEAAPEASPATPRRVEPARDTLARLVEMVEDTVDVHGASVVVDRGFLEVPARWDSVSEARLRLRIIRYRSRHPAPGPPLFYLAAGPGASGVRLLEAADWTELVWTVVSLTDFVAFDERGTGGSSLSDLRCPRPGFPRGRPLDPDERLRMTVPGFRACADSLRALGHGARVFSVAQTAADVHALRGALGYGEVFLLGESHGTHQAFAVLRRRPDRVAGAFLSGIEGPDHAMKRPAQIQDVLEELAAIARADARYHGLLDDLVGELVALRDSLAARPVRVGLANGDTVVVGEWDLRRWVAQGMGRQARMRALPSQVLDMTRGDFTALAEWAIRDREPWESRAMAVAIECGSSASAERVARIRSEAPRTFAGDVVNRPYPDICPLAGFPALPDTLRIPIGTDAPIVFLTGGLDARTPATNVDELISYYPGAVHFVVPNEEHTPFYHTEPYLRLLRRLLEGRPVGGEGPAGRDFVLDPPKRSPS